MSDYKAQQKQVKELKAEVAKLKADKGSRLKEVEDRGARLEEELREAREELKGHKELKGHNAQLQRQVEELVRACQQDGAEAVAAAQQRQAAMQARLKGLGLGAAAGGGKA